MNKVLLDYYNEQLRILKQDARLFAKAYPGVSHNLGLDLEDIADPHVARIIESFAFLTGKLQANLDVSDEALTDSIINSLYPHYNLPIPAYVNLKIFPDPVTFSSAVVPAGSLLKTSKDNIEAYFKTVYPLELIPYNIQSITWDKRLLHVSKSSYGYPFIIKLKKFTEYPNIKVNKIRFFINIEPPYHWQFYDILHQDLDGIIIHAEDDETSKTEIKKTAVSFMGFSEEENALPYPANANKAYRILTEYFAYQQKFLYFEVDIQPNELINLKQEVFQITFILRHHYQKIADILSKKSVSINCVPAINLFEAQGEAIHYDEKKFECSIKVSDFNAHLKNEIYDIKDIKNIKSSEDKSDVEILPLFKQSTSLENSPKIYYEIKRTCSNIQKQSIKTTDVKVRFFEKNLPAHHYSDYLLVPSLICTNHSSCYELIRHKTIEFEFVDLSSVNLNNIQNITQMIPGKNNLLTYENKIMLLQHLRSAYLGFQTDENHLNDLKDILKLYCQGNSSIISIIDYGLVSLTSKNTVKRHYNKMQTMFANILEYTLKINRDIFINNSEILLSKVIYEFLKFNSNIHISIELRVISNLEEEIILWK